MTTSSHPRDAFEMVGHRGFGTAHMQRWFQLRVMQLLINWLCSAAHGGGFV
jgi:hypothetical protein